VDSKPKGGAGRSVLVEPRQHFNGYSWGALQALSGNGGGWDGILAVFHSSWGKGRGDGPST
jgi:hypothetical protein